MKCSAYLFEIVVLQISEDELEEESKMRGLVDALGVDWASLVAESRPRSTPSSCAKIRWEPHNVLVNLGVSVQLAGQFPFIFNTLLVQCICYDCRGRIGEAGV